jgi:hypothetical protein
VNNGTKVLVGSLLGAGVGYVISKVMEREVVEPVGFADTEQQPKESLKERWKRAKLAGEEARLAKEAELRSYFRQKVNDPAALTREVGSRE